jgi:hypothetical protein
LANFNFRITFLNSGKHVTTCKNCSWEVKSMPCTGIPPTSFQQTHSGSRMMLDLSWVRGGPLQRWQTTWVLLQDAKYSHWTAPGFQCVTHLGQLLCQVVGKLLIHEPNFQVHAAATTELQECVPESLVGATYICGLFFHWYPLSLGDSYENTAISWNKNTK